MKFLALCVAFVLISSANATETMHGLRMRTIKNFTGPYGDDVEPIDELVEPPTDLESSEQTASGSCEPPVGLISGLAASATSNVALGAAVFRQHRKNVRSAAKKAKARGRKSTDGDAEQSEQNINNNDARSGSSRKSTSDKFDCGLYCASRC